jgi:two-component system phosphate regulon sensor histidine kinase PhoR
MTEKFVREKLPASIRAHIELLERMRQDFVANVSHELRTPLTVIRGYVELLKDQPEFQASRYAPMFTHMLEHTLRMGHLIDDLLLLSHLESHEQEVEVGEVVDVPALLFRVVDDAKNISGDNEHHITLTADSNLKLIGIKEELKSLFSNLIINAVKYTPKQGSVFIHWGVVDDQPVFFVKDTGIGIAKKHLPRITERFYRVDKARSRESGGTGLGLAIVKHVVLRHEAELRIESKLHEGSTFTCLFPMSRLANGAKS